MKTIRRYVGREIYGATLYVLVAFAGLFAFFDFVGELGDVGRGEYRVQHAVLFIALSMPARIYELMPVATLIGTIWALAMIASHSEFTIMRVSGLGAWGAIRTVFRIGLPIVVLTVLVGELVAPFSDRWAQDVKLRYKNSGASGQLRSGFWFRDAGKSGSPGGAMRRYVNVARLASDASAHDMRIYEFDGEFRLVSVLQAAQGRYQSSGHWVLTDVVQTSFARQGAGAAPPGAEQPAPAVPLTELVRAPELKWDSDLTPAILAVNMLSPDRMSVPGLLTYLAHLIENGQSTGRYEIALWRKVVYPFAILVMMALALPFAYLKVRSGGVSLKIFAGIMLGIGFYMLNQLFSHIGLLNTWSPLLSAGLPSVVALLGAFGALWWVERH